MENLTGGASVQPTVAPKTTLEENQFELPIGYIDASGTVHKIITMKVMDGFVDEAVQAPSAQENPGKLMTAIVAGTVVKIDDIPMTEAIAKSLSVPDREFIIVANSVVSFNPILTEKLTCGTKDCGIETELDINLQERLDNCKRMRAEEVTLLRTLTLPRGLPMTDGTFAKTITAMRINGAVQEDTAKDMRANPGLAQTKMLQKIIKKFDYHGDAEVIPLNTIKSLSKKDRDFIIKEMAGDEYSVDLKYTFTCEGCGRTQTRMISLVELLGE